jgi:hypothetical protein
MDPKVLNELGLEAEALVDNRPVLQGEQEKLDARAARIKGLQDELNDDQRHLNDRRKEGEQRLKAIRREIAQGRAAFARDQKADAREFNIQARDLEEFLDDADKEKDQK